MPLFLIRHPRPLIESGVCYGRLDVEADNPQALAAQLAPRLPSGLPIISSPLRRARRLAEALGPQVRTDARLSEIDFGEWEGRRWNEIDRHLLDAWAADMLHFVPPGGESAAMLQARVIDCLDSLRAGHARRLALVTHAGAIRAALGHCLRLAIDEWSQLPLAFGSISLLEIDGQANLRRIGCGQGTAQCAPATAARLLYLNR